MNRVILSVIVLVVIALGIVGTVDALTLRLGTRPHYNSDKTPLTMGTAPDGLYIDPQGATYNPQATAGL